MLTSLLGIRLMLLAGKSVPLPVPYDLMMALRRVEVTNDVSAQGDGFQMTFSLGKGKSGEYGLLSSGVLDPDTRVVIAVLLGVTPEVLIDGVIYHQSVMPSDEPGAATLTVMGRDVSVMLDLEEKDAAYPNQTDSIIVAGLLASYTQYGITPDLTPTTDVPIEVDRIPRQHETDLRFIRRMAERNGFVFYIEPLTVGVSQAHWGPENRLTSTQPALAIGAGSATNVVSFEFANDALAPVGTKGSFIEPTSKTSVAIPSLPSLRVPPLATSPVSAKRTTRLRCSANMNPAQAALAGASSVTNAPDAVTAEVELDTIRYGHVLRARRTVEVSGAGKSYDGPHYVRYVKHEIEPGKYRQKAKLGREGTGSLLPIVSRS
jgi:hypothetical protein